VWRLRHKSPKTTYIYIYIYIYIYTYTGGVKRIMASSCLYQNTDSDYRHEITQPQTRGESLDRNKNVQQTPKERKKAHARRGRMATYAHAHRGRVLLPKKEIVAIRPLCASVYVAVRPLCPGRGRLSIECLGSFAKWRLWVLSSQWLNCF